jgi:RNA recognition motif-containing protein
VFAGNLSFDVSREDAMELFGSVGPVIDIVMPVDRATGRPRGFAFVEYESEDDAEKAIETLDGREHAGRTLKIREARDRPPRMPRDMGGGPPPFDPDGRPFKRKGSRRGIRARKRGF